MNVQPARAIGIAAVTAGLLLLPSCSSSDPSDQSAATATTTAGGSPTTVSAPVIDPGDGGDYQPDIHPADFVETIDNPYLPLAVGARWVYEGDSAGATERIVVEVTNRRRDISGISATVVRDTGYLDGERVEDTFDWYAQDRAGNVWYLGEDSTTFENGQATGTEGSWEAGVDGALPGIAMPAHPTVGDAYRQEFYAGHAEDLADIRDVGASLTVPAGSYTDVLVSGEWSPLEPEVIEEKYYAVGVGNISSVSIAGEQSASELTEFTPGN